VRSGHQLGGAAKGFGMGGGRHIIDAHQLGFRLKLCLLNVADTGGKTSRGPPKKIGGTVKGGKRILE